MDWVKQDRFCCRREDYTIKKPLPGIHREICPYGLQVMKALERHCVSGAD